MSIFNKQERIGRLWDEHKADFLKLYSLEQSAKVTINHLEKSFVDLDGKQHYSFQQDKPLPTERYGRLMEYLMWFDGGFHKGELATIKDAMNKAFVAATKNPIHLSHIAYLIEELGSRQEMVNHTELLYNIVAIGLIREDESPEVFSERIHSEKIIAFKAFVAERGSYFFFQKFPLKELKRLKEMSESEWTIHWQESLIKQEKLKVMIKKLSSELESSKQEKVFMP